MELDVLQKHIEKAIARGIEMHIQFKNDEMDTAEFERRVGLIADSAVQEIALSIPSIDRVTFNSLNKVMTFARVHGAGEASEDYQQVLDWMNEEEQYV